MAELHAIQSVLNEPMIEWKEAKDVRWLSHDAAVAAILCTLPSLIVSLDREASERGEPTAAGLLQFHSSLVQPTFYIRYCLTPASCPAYFKRKMWILQ